MTPETGIAPDKDGPERIRIATQNESLISVQGLVSELFRTPDQAQVLDFSVCDNLGPTAVATIAAWRETSGKAEIDPTLAPDALEAYGLVQGSIDRIREQTLAAEPAPWDISEAYERILDFWTGLLRKEGERAAGASGELAVNAARHGGRDSGATMAAGVGETGGQTVAVFATVTFGDTIPVRVRDHLDKPALSDEEAVRWAAKKGRSTWLRTDDDAGRSPSGLGLTEARRQASRLNGRVEVWTGPIILGLGQSVCVEASLVAFQGTLARLVIPLP